jgi:hypothetical protein
MEPCGVPSMANPPFFVIEALKFLENWKLRKLVQ